MLKLKILILFLPILVVSCGHTGLVESDYSSEGAVFENRITFSISQPPLVLNLDSVTAPTTSMIQYLRSANEEKLAFWNDNDKSIVFFDLRTGTVVKKQFFDREGPNTVYASNFLIHAEDSMFMTDAVQSTYLVDSKSRVLNKYPVEDTNELEKSPGPQVWTASPMFFSDGNLYFQGYIGGVFNQPNIGRLNLESKEIDYFGGYPEFYTKAYWRGGYEYMYLTFNQKEKLVVQSYVADHHVRVLDLNEIDENQTRYFAGTSEFPSLKPPREKMGDPGHEEDERKFMLQPSFGLIHYDRFKDLYYRFAFEGLTESDFYSGDPSRATIKPSRIIILNASFEKVGEYPLPRFKYNSKMSFVGEKGFYVKIVNDENEDIIEFEVFEPIKMEK
ncbi:MAG: hypothetical protein ACI97P_002748 [Arcticibacterium sp.]|jgi:hypothetical protein